MTAQKIFVRCLAAMFRFNARVTKSSAAVRAAPGRNSTGTSLMRSSLQILIVAGAFSLLATTVRGASEIVIAIRYLQATGTSHAHLYLYREDGKLLRRLTNDNSGQDVAPIFDSVSANC